MGYDNSNIFAKILRGDIPSKPVYEDAYALAFHDIAPEAPVHVLVIPKQPFVSYDDFLQYASNDVKLGFFNAVQQTAKTLDVIEQGYRLITNHGENAGQSVPHFHIHIIAGKKLGKLVPES